MKIILLFFLFFVENAVLIAQDMIIPYRENDSWYYVTENKAKISSQVYQEAYPFGQNLAVVKLNDKYGFINKNEEIVIPCQYDYARSEFILMHVAIGTDTFWIDQNGNKSSKVYNDAKSFSKGRDTKLFSKNGKKGVVNIYNDTILPAKYSNIEILYYGAIIVWNNDAKIAIFDKHGEMSTPFKLDSFMFNDKYYPKFIFVFSEGKIGAVSLQGDLIALPKYEFLEYDYGLIYTRLNNGKKGYLYNGLEFWSEKN